MRSTPEVAKQSSIYKWLLTQQSFNLEIIEDLELFDTKVNIPQLVAHREIDSEEGSFWLKIVQF